MDALQSKSKDVKDTIERTTERLKKEQNDTLESIKKDASIKVLSIKDEINALNPTLASLKKDISDLEVELSTINGDIDLRKTHLLEVKSLVSGANDTLESTVTKRDKALEELNIATGALSDLATEKTRLDQEIDDKKQEIIEYDEHLSHIKQQSTSIIENKEDEVARMDQRLQEMTVQMNEFRNETDQTRRDLASRQKILDGKDQNLRIREQKVNQGEQRLMNNADLMNL